MLNNPDNTSEPNKFSICTNGEKQLNANTGDILLDTNTNRQYAIIMNNSLYDITLILGDKSKGAIGKGIVLKPKGNYEINSNNLYIGKVSAISTSSCKVSFVECVE